MGRLYPFGSDLVLEGNGGVVNWSTALPPCNLLPASSWLSVPLSITFPDFTKANAYAFDLETDGPLTLASCVSFSSILITEWGPTEPSPRTLADQVLGTVPAGVDYLDVRVTINRTKAPTNHLSLAVKNNVPTDETYLPGGSCIAEETSIWTRIFWIGLVGSNVVLRRTQSVYSGSNGITWSPGNAVYNGAGGKLQGWTYGGPAGADKAHLGQRIEGKGPSGNINKERGASNSCSLVDTTDFSSIWTGTALIRPGFLRA